MALAIDVAWSNCPNAMWERAAYSLSEGEASLIEDIVLMHAEYEPDQSHATSVIVFRCVHFPVTALTSNPGSGPVAQRHTHLEQTAGVHGRQSHFLKTS